MVYKPSNLGRWHSAFKQTDNYVLCIIVVMLLKRMHTLETHKETQNERNKQKYPT